MKAKSRKAKKRNRVFGRHVVARIQHHQQSDRQHQHAEDPGQAVDPQHEVQASAGSARNSARTTRRRRPGNKAAAIASPPTATPIASQDSRVARVLRHQRGEHATEKGEEQEREQHRGGSGRKGVQGRAGPGTTAVRRNPAEVTTANLAPDYRARMKRRSPQGSVGHLGARERRAPALSTRFTDPSTAVSRRVVPTRCPPYRDFASFRDLRAPGITRWGRWNRGGRPGWWERRKSRSPLKGAMTLAPPSPAATLLPAHQPPDRSHAPRGVRAAGVGTRLHRRRARRIHRYPASARPPRPGDSRGSRSSTQ